MEKGKDVYMKFLSRLNCKNEDVEKCFVERPISVSSLESTPTRPVLFLPKRKPFIPSKRTLVEMDRTFIVRLPDFHTVYGEAQVRYLLFVF